MLASSLWLGACALWGWYEGPLKHHERSSYFGEMLAWGVLMPPIAYAIGFGIAWVISGFKGK